jgi:anaerobic magnesium-protoporphyrin IX monomethyl ester cyclase
MQSKILLIHPPHTAIGQRIPQIKLPPFGLLRIERELIDAGFDVSMLDAESRLLSLFDIVRETRKRSPQIVFIGYSGSSSVQATVVILCAMLKSTLPYLTIACSGVLPNSHYSDYCEEVPRSVVLVEGESIARG